MLSEKNVALLDAYRKVIGRNFSYNTVLNHIMNQARRNGDTEKVMQIQLTRDIRIEITKAYIAELEKWELCPRFSNIADLGQVISLFFEGQFEAISEICKNRSIAYENLRKTFQAAQKTA